MRNLGDKKVGRLETLRRVAEPESAVVRNLHRKEWRPRQPMELCMNTVFSAEYHHLPPPPPPAFSIHPSNTTIPPPFNILLLLFRFLHYRAFTSKLPYSSSCESFLRFLLDISIHLPPYARPYLQIHWLTRFHQCKAHLLASKSILLLRLQF